MHAGGVHGVDGLDARYLLRNRRAGQLVDQLAEDRVFLRRPADHRKWPDRVAAMVNVLHSHYRKLVGQAVVAQVIAERTLGLEPVGIEPASDAEIGLGVNRQLAVAADHRHPPPAQHAGEAEFAHALGQGHHGGHGHGRRPAHEDVYSQFFVASQRGRVMGGDAAMNLIVQAHLAVRLILPAGKLHAIHAQVAAVEARRVGVFGIDLRQGDVRPAVVGPRFQLRQLVDRGFALQYRAGADFLRACQQRRPGRIQVEPRPPHQIGRIDLQRDELLEPVQRIAEDVPRPLHRAEEVAEHREAAADDVRQQQGRPSGAKHPSLDFRRFEVRIDRRVDVAQLPRCFQVVNALAEVAIHGK